LFRKSSATLVRALFTIPLMTWVASAAPTLTVGSATGAAGTEVSIPVSFNPTTDAVALIEFDVTLPASISTVSVTAGAVATAASKSVSTSKVGTTWKFLIFGLNADPIGAGALLTARVKIAAGTAAGSIPLATVVKVYSDADGQSIVPGVTTSGNITVPSTIPSPVINSALTATAQVGAAFSYQITATNSPTSFAATGLPSGVSINTTSGLISGTPTAPGTFNVTLNTTNAGGTGSATLILTVAPATTGSAPAITSPATADGLEGAVFVYLITASNSPTSFGATGLPSGLSISPTSGLISGTPTMIGTSNVTISATNRSGTGTLVLALTVRPSAPIVTSAATATGKRGDAFTYQITASNNPTSFGGTGLPSGVALNSATGLISGTLTSAGTFTLTVSATNSGGTGSRTVTLTVTQNTPPTVSAINHNAADVNASRAGLQVYENTSVVYSGSANDAESDTLTWQWFYRAGSDADVSMTGGASPPIGVQPVTYFYPLGSAGDTYTWTLRVNDGFTTVQSTLLVEVVARPTTENPDMPAPTLRLPENISVEGDVTAEYPSGYALTGFEWTFTPIDSTSGTASSSSRTRARVSAVSFPSASGTASLKNYALSPGRYTVSVVAKDSSGRSSPAASALVNLVNASFDAVKVYPNPWRKDRHSGRPIIFSGLPVDARVQIFTLSGQRVTSLPSTAGQATWDGLKNDGGEAVASGIYIYMISITNDEAQKTRGKLVIIR
jgi:hypothetical protein